MDLFLAEYDLSTFSKKKLNSLGNYLEIADVSNIPKHLLVKLIAQQIYHTETATMDSDPIKELVSHHNAITNRHRSLAAKRSHSTSKTELFIVVKKALDSIVPAIEQLDARLKKLEGDDKSPQVVQQLNPPAELINMCEDTVKGNDKVVMYLLDRINNNYHFCANDKKNTGIHEFMNIGGYDNFEAAIRRKGKYELVYDDGDYKIYKVTRQ